jgi:hypothetical protein
MEAPCLKAHRNTIGSGEIWSGIIGAMLYHSVPENESRA